MDQFDFDINESLKLYLSDPATIPTPEAHGDLVDCEADPELLTLPLINGVLEAIVDAVAENPDGLMRSSSFDTLQLLLKCAPTSALSQTSYPKEPDTELFRLSRNSSLLPASALSTILALLVSGLSTEADIIHNDMEGEEQDALHHHKRLLELYGFLMQWAIAAVETKASEKSSAAPARKGTKGAKSKSAGKDGTWDSIGE